MNVGAVNSQEKEVVRNTLNMYQISIGNSNGFFVFELAFRKPYAPFILLLSI
jgi:hypothetical protein